MRAQPERKTESANLLERCLGAYVEAGTLDLSLDQLAERVGISKRMLIHYFGGRENLEELAMTCLEERLRAQFARETFPAGISAESVVAALWERTTAPEAKGVLLLVMDVSRRAWSGSRRASAFYAEQQRLWVELLLTFLPDRSKVEEILQLFQGAVLGYLISGDPRPGKRSLMRIFHRQPKTRRKAKLRRPDRR